MKLLKTTKKELGLVGVFSLAVGATLGGGFFLLPSLATVMAGPAVVLSYFIAGILLIPPMLSKIELATAMPRSGGAYYFLDRSLGPMVGTVGGFGVWLALILKTGFALVGMGFYIQLFLPDGGGDFAYTSIALALLAGFTVLNILGAKKTSMMQIVFVIALLILLSWFLCIGLLDIANDLNAKLVNFDHFFKNKDGEMGFLAAAGLVFISYGGLTKVISVAGEIKDPERNLPLGLFLAIGATILIFVLGIFVMVAIDGTTLGPEGFVSHDIDGKYINYTSVSTVALHITGSQAGLFAMAIAAIIAFLAVANAGILSASRFPLAMSSDHLMPKILEKTDHKGTPVLGVLLSSALIAIAIIFLDPLKIAKLASAFQLLILALLCISVVVMRETKLDSYDPGYRAPFYPWLQIFGAISCIALIIVMGWLPILFSLGIIVAGIVWYFAYAEKRVDRYGGIYHVFERLGRRRFAALDVELREILKEKGLRAHDPFDEIVAASRVIDAPRGSTFEDIVITASDELASLLPATASSLSEGFLHGTRVGATPVTGGVALPHLRIPDITKSIMVVARSKDGITVDVGDAFGGHHEEGSVHAIFFLVSPESDPSQHLRLLGQIAGNVDQEGFMTKWLTATTNQEMKEILLRENMFVSIELQRGTKTETFIDIPIHRLGFPDGCLVALIHRRGHMVIPRGSTVLEEGDHLTIIGDERGIRSLKDRFVTPVNNNDD